ncbi:hypothetical protein ONS95_004375 [Cadophora gregata]|uniref:uncharacterized protein n=1 Tax=Cadophora gregata TaxID=51156 RepID=UPI0026DAD14F|nr:uncharacterized protein ONS95_004375 [Cadophora gregata]KAK0105234.1 hypothetical protein ONS96_004633 [Cadophora gregata f. sp. sojae]KAK0105861.1 hypothetical protein ONS95_004375 [Cadophora gregata]
MAPTHDITTYTKRLMPHIIDERAKAGYSRPFALYPKSIDPSEGFHSISYARIANAVNRAAWWLDSGLTSQEEKENPFAYFGANDLRYVIFLMAMMKTGRKMLFASTRNLVRAQLSLFSKINCRAIVFCSSLNQSFQPLIAASELRHIQAPKLEDLLAEDPVPHYTYDATWESLSNEKFFTVHTSGSSGDPKPISAGKHYIGAVDSMHCLPDGQGQVLQANFRFENLLILLPCFHLGGLVLQMLAPLIEMTMVLGHPDVPMSSAYVAELLKTDHVTALASPPSILEDLSKESSSLQSLSKLKHIAYGGGPLHPNTGNLLAKSVPHIFSFIGATEIGWFHCVNGSNDLWDSLHYFDNIGYTFDEVSKDIYEPVLVNDEKTKMYHGVFEVFPELREYRTKDLYSRHPTASGWMRYRGRSDDLIVLSNGEKINPIPMENIVNSHPAVKAALVVGEYQFSASLLVELKDVNKPRNEHELRERLDDIWPYVEDANKIAPGFAKIPKSLVVFTTPEKPFLRAGKGTVQRQLTVKAYTQELDRLYASQEGSLLTEGLTLTKGGGPNDIRIFVREIYKQAMEDDSLSDSEDVFQKGLDSLGVSVIVRRLKAALEACSIPLNIEDINPRFVYSAANVSKLTSALLTLRNTAQGVPYTNGIAASEKESMASILEKYSGNIPTSKSEHRLDLVETPWTVLVTGSTGSLGSYILAALDRLPKSRIGKIVCLNRSADAKERQRKSSLSRGINASWHDSDYPRVQFLQADFCKVDLGLDPDVYAKLLQEATVIIHSAWKVDFNLPIEFFESQVHGVRNLLDFSLKSTKQAPLMFTSSISAAFGWMDTYPLAKVPEAIISSFKAPEKIGYAESKFMCEQLLDRFTTASGVTTAVLRTGQIAGPITKNGMWNKQEWLPSIIASSKHLGILPETLGSMDTVDWVPVDLLSTIILELAERIVHHKSTKDQGTLVYNLVNPQTTTWSSLLPTVQESIGVQKVVSFSDWVQALQQSSTANNGAFVASNPGVKLLDFYHEIGEKESAVEGSRYAVDNLICDSKQASDLTAVSPEWMRLWLRQWSF